jgi:ribosomal-protein-alanine N-acetyltransferase
MTAEPIDDQGIETPRLVLEPLLPSHAATLFPLLRDEALYRFIPQEPPTTIEEVEARYRRLAARRSPDGSEVWLYWAARLRSTGEYLGVFQATARPDATALIAYTVFVPFQGHGYAHEGCRAVLDALASSYAVKLAIAEIDTRNFASIALVESLGFQRAGMVPDADFFKGATSDEYRYELDIRPEEG